MRLIATKTHPWFGRLWLKLKDADIARMFEFCDLYEYLDDANWEMAVNRMFMDLSRPPRWKEISELLLVSGKRVERRKR